MYLTITSYFVYTHVNHKTPKTLTILQCYKLHYWYVFFNATKRAKSVKSGGYYLFIYICIYNYNFLSIKRESLKTVLQDHVWLQIHTRHQIDSSDLFQ